MFLVLLAHVPAPQLASPLGMAFFFFARGLVVAVLLVGAAAGAALAAVCAASTHWLLADWATHAFWSKCAALFGTIVAGGGVFLGCAALLKVAELAPLIEGVRRRLGRTR